MIPVTEYTMSLEQKQNQLKAGQEVARTAADIGFLESSCPEGFTTDNDENVHYFLAVGELEKTNEILRKQLEISEKNLASMDADFESTNAMVVGYQEVYNELIEAVKAKEQKKKEKTPADRENALTNKSDELSVKIRTTNIVYKQLKTFLADFLARLSPEDKDDDSELAKLLQALWNAFQTDSASYINVEDLDFDVDERIVAELDRGHMIDHREDEPTFIKFKDFTK